MVFMKDADACERKWNTDVQTTALNPHIMIRLVILIHFDHVLRPRSSDTSRLKKESRELQFTFKKHLTFFLIDLRTIKKK